MSRLVVIGVSLKMYFTHRQTREWCSEVAQIVRESAAVRNGQVEFFVAPTYLAVLPALEAFAGTRVLIGAQDVAANDSGAFTGEVSGRELAEVGVRIAEVGHAERRRLFGETDQVVAAKTAAALRNSLTPVVCVGEADEGDAALAAHETVRQLRSALEGAPAGRVIVAYEPVWAIGADAPAPPDHVRAVSRELRAVLTATTGRDGSSVVYGGSAEPGLLTRLYPDVHGLFLGRAAHDPDAVRAVLDEAAALGSG